MTAVPQAVRDAADAWAREHGCRNSLGCNQTPLSAFAAGMAAERERIIHLAQENQATYWVGPDDSLAPRRPFALLLRVGPLAQESTATQQERR